MCNTCIHVLLISLTRFNYVSLSIFFSFTAQDGISPLYVASQFGHTEVVDVLLNAGADVHQATTKVHNPQCMYVYYMSLCCVKKYCTKQLIFFR